MRPYLRVLGLCAALGVAGALPVAISPTWGWLGSAALALAGGAVVAVHLARRYAEPLERLVDQVRPVATVPHASAAELARLVAFEYRDAVSRLREAVGEVRRRETALAHSAEGVLLVDSEGRVEYANPAARAVLHGRVMEITHRLSLPELQRLVRQARELGAVVTEELDLRLPAPRHVLARAVPLADGGTLLVLRDRSETHRLEEVRRDFVANVSHELKTPVAGLRALADVAVEALRDGDPQTALRFAERIQAESERLSELVGDLLDLSRVEAGQDMRLEPVDVRELAAEVAERLRAAAEAKGIALLASGPPAVAEADRAQVAMALQNLVDNAIRYSESGTVRVTVAVRDEWVAVSVADDGIGIPSAELPRIFERFYRVDRARSRATGGTGLGLSIVRHVAENHGGRVEVRSELGAGSTFTLYLPRSSADRRGDAA